MPTRHSLMLVATVVLGFVGAFPGVADPAPARGIITLTDVYTFDGTLDRLLNSSLASLHPKGPGARDRGRVLFVNKTIDGIRFAGFPVGADITDRRNLETRQSRITIELWLPRQIDYDDPSSAWLYVAQASGSTLVRPRNGTILKRALCRRLARVGIPAAIWYEADQYPVQDGAPVGSIPHQFGYRGDGDLLHTGLTWMIQKDPSVTPLDAQDLRYHFRFGMSQGYMLATTFVQRFIEKKAGPKSFEWSRQLRTVLAGGSKYGTAVLTVCGIDPRVRGARVSGSQSGNPDSLGVWPRYIKDWKECPGGRYGVSADFTTWSERNADNAPSYYDIYAMGRDPDRYRHILFLDIVGSHDYANPLGSHSTFWEQRDGLVNGLRDRSEERWNFRILRRPNKNHGASYDVGQENGLPVRASHVLAWHAMRNLVKGAPLPRMDLVSVDISGIDTWTFAVRVIDGTTPDKEHYKVFAALSDDRDFRRCTAPVETNPNGECHEGIDDDNKEIEDRFIPLEPLSVVRRGAYRVLTVPIPPEYGQFSQVPLIAAFVELHREGNKADRLADDLWLHTRIEFKNVDLYPEQRCE